LGVGNTVKLRGTPKAKSHQPCVETWQGDRVMTSCMVKALFDVTMDNPQPSPKSKDMEKVQRLDGSG